MFCQQSNWKRKEWPDGYQRCIRYKAGCDPESRGKHFSLLPHLNALEEGDFTLSPYPHSWYVKVLQKKIKLFREISYRRNTFI